MNNSFSTPIGSSELIINESGKIYHLNLAPHEIADTVITVGDPDRVKLVSQYFDKIEYIAQHREFVTHTGYIGQKRISVVSTGIGPDNIDIVFNELDALVNIDFETRLPKETHQSLSVIRLGTSGALQANIPVDSFVVSSFGIGLDNLLHYYQHSNNQEEAYILSDFQTHCKLINTPIVPYIAEGSIRLRNHFTQGYKQGITVTCPGFYGPQGRILRGAVAFPHLIDALSTFDSRQQNVTNFEMETSAIYGLGKILGHQCLSISTIVANRIEKTFSKDSGASVDKMIRQSLELVETL
ncbi:nucleoside phosphorylase [Taibaiella soli]|uniref:Uridine phosphorylase n=1 Tax=Taibaiella soli TaxID=1649169 RepID=A0A2W2B3Z3_9BACT|nr:nucleoside phosphorylase [Taibaiella soli]PZF70959.1 phosphorylase [Taibaiella soli]